MRQWEQAAHQTLSPKRAEVVLRAMWAGDTDTLWDIAPCRCCCADHTYCDCQARLWGGCRGGLPFGEERDDEHSWLKFYAQSRGMTQEQFYCYGNT